VTKAHLALEELERSSTTGGNVAELVLLAGVGNDGSSVATSNNNSRSVLDGLDGSVEKGGGSLGKVGELEDTGGTVPEDGLGLGNSLGEDLSGLGSSIETHPTVGDTLGVGSGSDLRSVISSAHLHLNHSQSRPCQTCRQ
jgi:hypothetical protein